MAILLFVSIVSCSDDMNEVIPDYIPQDSTANDTVIIPIDTTGLYQCYICRFDSAYVVDFTAHQQQLFNELNDAYNSNCLSCLLSFFKTWQISYESTDISLIENDTIKAVYDIYKAFYRPWDLYTFYDGEFGNNLFSGIEFMIIQEEIFYNTEIDTPQYLAHNDRIDNFRPAISSDANPINPVYLNEDYRKVLNYFLGVGYIRRSCGGNQDCFDLPQKSNFINQAVRILGEHWDDGWHLETHPYIFNISFNAQLDSAFINFRVIYQGGEAILKKVDGEWDLVESYATWIE
ncbi:MAG: hypothetical protein R2753_00960 [Chitinophagales bacterium]